MRIIQLRKGLSKQILTNISRSSQLSEYPSLVRFERGKKKYTPLRRQYKLIFHLRDDSNILTWAFKYVRPSDFMLVGMKFLASSGCVQTRILQEGP